MRDFVVLAIFGIDTRVVAVAVDAALDGLAGRGAGLDGPPAASDEAVAAAYDDDDDEERPPAPLPRCDRRCDDEVLLAADSSPLVEAVEEEFIGLLRAADII
jgi:hypothetical protein